MDGLSVLTNGSEVDKLKFLFQVYDVDGEWTGCTFDVVRAVPWRSAVGTGCAARMEYSQFVPTCGPAHLSLVGNGVIDYDELRVVLKSCMNESALSFSDAKLDELTRALFEDADTDNSGAISFEELQAELDKHPGVVENLTIRSSNSYCSLFLHNNFQYCITVPAVLLTGCSHPSLPNDGRWPRWSHTGPPGGT